MNTTENAKQLPKPEIIKAIYASLCFKHCIGLPNYKQSQLRMQTSAKTCYYLSTLCLTQFQIPLVTPAEWSEYHWEYHTAAPPWKVRESQQWKCRQMAAYTHLLSWSAKRTFWRKNPLPPIYTKQCGADVPETIHSSCLVPSQWMWILWVLLRG